MLRKTCYSAKSLPTFATLDLHATVSMHSFVTTQIRKLGIAFIANLASKRFYAAVNMSVLFKPRTGCKSFSTFGTCMTSCSYMVSTYMSLKVAWVCKHFIAVLTWKSSVFSMNHFVTKEIWSPSKAFVAMLASILTWFVSMSFNHVIV